MPVLLTVFWLAPLRIPEAHWTATGAAIDFDQAVAYYFTSKGKGVRQDRLGDHRIGERRAPGRAAEADLEAAANRDRLEHLGQHPGVGKAVAHRAGDAAPEGQPLEPIPPRDLQSSPGFENLVQLAGSVLNEGATVGLTEVLGGRTDEDRVC